MNLPLVSIVTPTLNSCRFVETCITSVLGQDYPNVEHIIQDGGSSDGTIEILGRYTERVKWVSEPDLGQADALDKAIKRSCGDILLVLNADDALLSDAISWGVKQMEEYPDEAAIYGDVRLIDEQGEIIGQFVGPEYDFPSVLCVERVIPAQAAFIRRSSLEAVGLGSDPTLDTCPDFEMFVRLGLNFPMRHVRRYVINYRHYYREMDGSKPRTVDRFIRAKHEIMDRVFESSDTPTSIRRMRLRARAGLYLWGSEVARGEKEIEEAWNWYNQALSLFSATDRSILKSALLQAVPVAYIAMRSPFDKPIRAIYRWLAAFLLRPKRRGLGLGILPSLLGLVFRVVGLLYDLSLRLSKKYEFLALLKINLEAAMAWRLSVSTRPASAPSFARALIVGLSLVQETPGFSRVARALRIE